MSNIIKNANIISFVDIDATDVPFNYRDLDFLIEYEDKSELGEHLYNIFTGDDDLIESNLPQKECRDWLNQLKKEVSAISPDICYVRIIPKPIPSINHGNQ